ncbi:MAG TPA: SPOR domain-containing protein [Gaiellaceae bacterium]|nr:SPOR domain-containing protein [Gaiellaceae bacterium]
MSDDWRIRVELSETANAEALLGRLGVDLAEESRRLAEELQGRRLAVSNDEDTVFVYLDSPAELERARQIVEAELSDAGIQPTEVVTERWLPEEERWSGEPPSETWEEEELGRGHAPWEVRVELDSHAEAEQLADRLEGEGYDVARRWRYLIVGAASEEEARELARRVHGDAEPGGEVVWEARPSNPFAVFGGLGG